MAPKNPIKKFNEGLSPEQMEAKKLIDESIITILQGEAASGKTFLSICYALEKLSLARKKGMKIFITRATVFKKSHNNGFLPGDIQEKFDPWLRPIYDNMEKFISREEIDQLKKEGIVEIVPLMYVQGRTLENSIVVVDECQNLQDQEVEMLFTRLGVNSKMIFCGDVRQKIIDERSGLEKLSYLAGKVPGLSKIRLTQNFRSPIVKELLDAYKEFKLE